MIRRTRLKRSDGGGGAKYSLGLCWLSGYFIQSNARVGCKGVTLRWSMATPRSSPGLRNGEGHRRRAIKNHCVQFCSQIGQSGGGSTLGGYCVPHVTQIALPSSAPAIMLARRRSCRIELLSRGVVFRQSLAIHLAHAGDCSRRTATDSSPAGRSAGEYAREISRAGQALPKSIEAPDWQRCAGTVTTAFLPRLDPCSRT